MRLLRTDASVAEPIGPRPYRVRKTASVKILEGAGEAHAYVLHFEPGGEIGPHEAGFGQLFVALSGSGWVAGPDGERIALGEGQAAFFPRGDVHSKGSETGLTALMFQVRDLGPQVEH
jgi:quercetin dioxygenase-like cupin family protein